MDKIQTKKTVRELADLFQATRADLGNLSFPVILEPSAAVHLSRPEASHPSENEDSADTRLPKLADDS